MQARDVMTSNVVTVTPDTTVRELAQLLVKHRISATPVVDEKGHVIGMVSEGDLLHRSETDTEKRQGRRSWWLDLVGSDGAADYVKSHARKVGEIMSRNVVCVEEDASLGEIAALLESRHIKRVPVLRDRRLVGIVSRSNLVQALASAPDDEAEPGVSPSDNEIRAMLMGELSGRGWAFPGRNIVVRNGVVHLWGTVWSTEQLEAMRTASVNIPGVKYVEDHTIPYPIMPGI
ncbi:CBS domain-containing protein [Caballeronia concitans]|uniref:CBS domain-containing protein n=1 Tax=Caballeronia concitans TaxID=1777133 RepID=A0A658QUK6_9BURK|nr:CBS domain-containing protein [Caballeronia concitans]KIG07558.1 CBS domain containing membrane protein [Burkholderia sp. MR1]SAL23234.1 CBS domain-containing protein [Caballeronia concitans]